MAKYTPVPIATTLSTSAATSINENLEAISDAIENTLSRDGTVPNQMTSDLDMNHYDAMNINITSTDRLFVDGFEIIPEEQIDHDKFALKETLISTGTGLVGGGDLSADRTIQLSPSSIDSLAKADAALPAADYTASDVLAKIKTVDGTASGLDTDLVRGTTPGTTGLNLLAAATPTAAKTVLSLQNVDNTSDLNKPVSTSTQAALDLKVNSATFTEDTQDIVAAMLKAGTNITLSYNDPAGELTINSTATINTSAGSVTVAPIANLTATDAQAAFAEHQLDIDDALNGNNDAKRIFQDTFGIYQPSAIDFNTITERGLYIAGGSNNPPVTPGVTFWYVRPIQMYSGSAKMQIAVGYRGSGTGDAIVYSRIARNSDGAWGNWGMGGAAPLSGAVFTGNVEIAKATPRLDITKTNDATTCGIEFNSSDNLADWIILTQVGTSPDFQLLRRDAAGGSVDSPFSVSYTTGDVTMPNVLKLNKPVTINGRSHEFYAAENAVHPGNTAAANSAGLKAAYDAVIAAGGGTLVLPRGISPLSGVSGDQVQMEKSLGVEVIIRGQSRSSGLGIPTTTSAALFVGSNVTAGGSCGIIFKDMTFKGSGAASGRAIKANNANLLRFEGVQFLSHSIFLEAANSYFVNFTDTLSDHIGLYGMISTTTAHGIRMSRNAWFNTGVVGTGTALRLDGGMTDNLYMEGNDFEYCRQVLNASGGLSCSRINGNYIEYHLVDPLGFGGVPACRGIEIKGNWIALGSGPGGTMTLSSITDGEVKWNRFHNQNVTGKTVGTEGDATKNYLTGTSVWT